MTLPPDRGHLATEGRNPRSARLHALSVDECVRLIQAEDRAVLDALDGARDAIAAFIRAAEPGFARGGRLVYLGAGTSGRLAVLDASEAPPTYQVDHGRVVGIIAGGDAALRRSSEGLEDDPEGAATALDALALTCDDTVIAIAAGGTTPYALGALAIAKRRPRPPLTAFIACVDLPTPPHADHLIALRTGAEIVTGSTRMKAGTATKLCLNTISTTLMVRIGKVYDNLMVDVRASNAKLRDRAARIVATLTGVDRAGAFALLESAGGAAKTAIAMYRLGVDRAEAERRLAAVDGRLDRVIG